MAARALLRWLTNSDRTAEHRVGEVELVVRRSTRALGT